MSNPLYVINVEAAIYREDKYLIIKRSEKEEHALGVLSLVGGKVDGRTSENNVLENSVKREILEEVGVEVSNSLHYIESNSFISDKGYIVVNIGFLCKYESGEARCVSEDEVSEVHWMGYDEILSNPKAPSWLKSSLKKAESVRLIVENF
ncbi:NUDIX domain-containing protein [Clostridium sp. YIM B02505]|uniref:NUDIX domain-containing protein n=1 Tax=Clostridium yunnanense TaxID=2800325 RepID=A0ABS1ERE2_9CLOT|nr:NUDIX domain-containing protein [Clostridium yunnanense]MBK1811959.1 NUDIX domain-containing protein [Clostridium yunnanense]